MQQRRQQVQILFANWAFKVPEGKHELDGATLHCKKLSEASIRKLADHRQHMPTLVVLNAEQYLNVYASFSHHNAFSMWSNPVRFFIVDSPESPATVRQIKSIRETEGHLEIRHLRAPYSRQDAQTSLLAAVADLLLRKQVNHLQSIEVVREDEAAALNEIGHAMTRYQSVDQFLKVVLDNALKISGADAGFIILQENLIAGPEHRNVDGASVQGTTNRLVRKSLLCKSQPVGPSKKILDPTSSSFISFLSNHGSGATWSDVHEKPQLLRQIDGYKEVHLPHPEFDFNPATYEVRSFTCFPLRSPNEHVFGFMFVLNCKLDSEVKLTSRDDVAKHVVPFSARKSRILEAIANQCAVSLDHLKIYRDLKNTFESFVHASVIAIEARDPTTKGHSERVAIMTVALAEALNETTSGPYSSIHFTDGQLYELRFASLLHDFGKIGVREAVLHKEKKLLDHEMERIDNRFKSIEQKIHIHCMHGYLDQLLKESKPPQQTELERIQTEVKVIAGQLKDYFKMIQNANEPHILRGKNLDRVVEIAAAKIKMGTENLQLLTEDEVHILRIPKGSLTESERREIESHVTHSYNFLKQIPWSNELAQIPTIVYTHHERNNGTGYPRRIQGEDIPLQAKMMAITDIYDALVAMDRPYKKAVAPERALEILEAEVKEGKLDPQLFQIFREARVWDLITREIRSTAA